MAASIQCRHQDRSLGMVMKEVDGDLATFLEMQKREKESNGFAHIHNSDGFDDSTASNADCSVFSDTIFTETLLDMSPADNFLDAESQKSDHDWLLTPPRTPSFPSLEVSVQSSGSQIATSSALPAAQTSKPENPPSVPSSLNDTSVQPITSTSDTSSVSRNRKPSSARQKSTASRSATPTGRSKLPAASWPSRSSTPTSRGIAASNKPVAPPVRSSTPTRVAARSATPPARSSIPSTSKSTSRSATPTLKSSISSSVTPTCAPSGRSSSVAKAVPTMSKTMGSRVGIVPTVKSRPKTLPDVPFISSDAPTNLKMTMPKRPSSASRGRSTASGSQFSSSNLTTAGPRQKSCSPSRGRAKGGALDTGKTLLSRSRGHSNGSADVNPVLIGTKMVERVVNMRKLAPPKHDSDDSHDNSAGGKSSSSQDNAGFGRSLSKKSLDMAIRHMDITRSITGNLKTIVTSIPAASLLSRRTGSSKTSTTSASDSPLATSSNTSSEPSVHNISHVLDNNGVEVYDIGSEREFSPTNSQN